MVTNITQRMRSLLETIDYDFERFSLPSFCLWLEEITGKQLLFKAAELPLKIFGAWITSPSHDLVIYQKNTNPLHRQHIILHELCHILCGHQTVQITDQELLKLVPLPQTVPKVLCRSADPDLMQQQDQEVELLVELIVQKRLSTDARQRLSRRLEQIPERLRILGE